MQSIYYEIQVLNKQKNSCRDRDDAEGRDTVGELQAQLETLRQSLNDTIQMIGGKSLLDYVPATPPLEDVSNGGGSGPHGGVGIGAGAALSPRGGCPPCDTRGKRKRVPVSGETSGRRARKRQSDARLPTCLRDLHHPMFDESYMETKVGAFMTANIMVMNLQRLQPRAQVVPLISRGTVVLLHEAISLRPSILHKATSDKGGLASLVCASFWLLAKFGGIRGVTPDAALVSLAAGIEKPHVKQMEIEIMNAIGWDIVRALKRHAHLGLDVDSLIM